MRVMKAIVAEVNPTLYTAAQRANLSPKEQNQIEQMSWAVKKNKELNGLGNEQARLEYSKLDVNVQEGLKFFYKDADYMQEPPTFTDKAVGALKFTGKLLASPLIGLFKVAGALPNLSSASVIDLLSYRSLPFQASDQTFQSKIFSPC